MQLIECFKIRLLEGELDGVWDVDSMKPIYEIPCDGLSVDGNPVIIVADPFLFVHNDNLYLFYEEKKYRDPGVLKMIRTNDMKTWSEPCIILKEPFHLSYPYVFEDEGQIFMIPETCAAGEVRLYKADNNELSSFSLDSVLLKHDVCETSVDIDFSDSSVYKHSDGQYYLMTTLCINGVNELFLYISDCIRGPYVEHPMSPIVISQKYGRNAGCLLKRDGKLYRVAQDCVKRYGDNIHLFEITDLSDENYSEALIKENLLDTKLDFYSEGGHQLNIAEFKGKTIVALDAKEYNSFFLNRLVGKIKDLI